MKISNVKMLPISSIQYPISSSNSNWKLATLVLATLATMATFAKTFTIDVSAGRPAVSNEAYYHGETIEFRAVRGRETVTNIEFSCVYYQTNGMGQTWWKTDGLVFHPTNDCGAAAYRFFLEGRDDIGRDWHANGLLRLLDSPGFEPNVLELPVSTLDFANIEVLNAPWPDEADIAASTNALASAIAATYKPKQAAKKSPTAGITEEYQFIDTISQDTNGVITATKKSMRKATTSVPGMVQLNDSLNSTRTDQAATANALHFVAGKADAAIDAANAAGLAANAALAQLSDSTNALASAVAAAYKPKQAAKASPSAATTEAYQFIDTISQDTNGVITATKKTMRKATTSAPGMVQLNDNIDSTRTDHAATANAVRKVAETADAAMDAANAAGLAATDAEAKATAVATAATNYTDSVAAPIWSYVLGDRVWFAVTNYMRTISGVAPSLQLWEVRDGATNLIYSSTEEVSNLVANAVAPLATTQALHDVQAALPSKAWSRYQSATGADNPEPATVTIVSTPVVQLTGGGEWQPHTLAAGGTVWTLESNGITTIGGGTNGNLVIRNTITGEEVFSVEERSFIPSVPVVDSFTPKSGGNGFVLSVYADARPTLYTATNLTDRVKVAWDAEGDDPNVVVNSWTNNGDGTWTVDVSLVVPSTSYYAYVGVSESTESIISNKRAVSFDGGVYVDGAKWQLGTATINGVKVLTVEAMP